jgi:type I restriction enzyme S subunit
LGEIPEHWAVPALKWFILIASGEGLSHKDIEPIVDNKCRYKVIGGNGILGYSSKYNTTDKVFSIGRVGALCGNVHFFNEACWITDNSLKISSWRKLADMYLYHLLLAANLNDYANRSAQPLITGGQVKSLKIPFPPLQEQETIANYLDKATVKIDTLIGKQTKLIELLKEKRQAVISTAVTCGLDSSVPMKDSGVEWLGEIPEGWILSKLRYVFSFGKGLTITKANLVDKGVPCVNYGEIHSKYGFEVDADKHILKCVDTSYLSDSKSSLLSIGDFVFADTSEDIEGAGNFTHVSSEAQIFAGYHTIKARQIGEQSFRFLAYLIDSEIFRTQIRLAVKGVKVYSITQAILRASIVWLPKIEEQQKIANYLDDKTSKIDNLITKATKAIDLLGERRTALVSAVVTGKIDVRGEVL